MSSIIKRKEAIRTLISIIENTSFVVKPYFYFPELKKVIQSLVSNETDLDIKKHTFRLIGTLGAVDPYLYTQISKTSDQADVSEVSDIFSGMP